jgi:hypothetical protein
MRAKQVIAFLSALTVLAFAGKGTVLALEISIEGNGAGADSTVAVQEASTTTVQQTNETSVNNQVEVTADTGNNEASGNGGDTQITTGDVTADTNISNSVNQSQIDSTCCPGPGETTVTVSGNGAGSANTVDLTTGTSTNVTVIQNATITNIINGMAVTGRNLATDNQGNVYIETGDIRGNVNILNGVNTARIEVAQTADGSVMIKIVGNGSGSVNTILYQNTNEINITKHEEADIFNTIGFEFITGENIANGNSGDVTIKTGDIVFEANIANDPVNDNVIKVDCCPEKPVTPPIPPIPPIPPVNPPTPPNDGGNSGGGSSSSSSSSSSGVGGAGQVLGETLPATGSLDMLLMFIANIFLLLLGCYLRLRSGRAPAISRV